LDCDNHACRYCGGWASEADHYQPFSRGGLTVESNLVAACVYCNRSKGDRTEQEWRQAQAIKNISDALAERRTRSGQIRAVVGKSRPRHDRPNPDAAAAHAALLRRSAS
jgi:HNH endonuclease